MDARNPITSARSRSRRVVVTATPAMAPAVGAGVSLVVADDWYEAHDVIRFDSVLARRDDTTPGGAPASDQIVLRVIGLPGETIELRAGEVCIDGEVLDEPFHRPRCSPGCDGRLCCAMALVRIPTGCYFLMGDNRPYVLDSRYLAKDAFPRRHLIARVLQALA